VFLTDSLGPEEESMGLAIGVMVLGLVLNVSVVLGGDELARGIEQLSATATRITACYDKKTGSMRFPIGDGKCKSTENRISWNVAGPIGPRGPIGPIGPVGPQGAPGAAGPEGPAGFISVHDANDQYLGVLVNDIDSVSVSVYVPSLKKTAVLVQTSQSSSKADFYPIVTRYQTDNCTGEPLIDYAAYLYINRVFKVGSKYYTGSLPGIGQVAVQSFLALNGSCVQLSTTISAYKLEEIFVDQIPFTLPISLPLKFDNN
jgi:hypothetical protein